MSKRTKSEEFSKKLLEKYPKLFKKDEFQGIPIMPYIDGWFGIIENLCIELDKRIQAVSSSDQNMFSVSEVKIKFLKLLVRLHGPITSEMEELLRATEKKSQTICQFCGEPGTPAEKGRWLVVCPVHKKYYPDIDDALREKED